MLGGGLDEDPLGAQGVHWKPMGMDWAVLGCTGKLWRGYWEAGGVHWEPLGMNCEMLGCTGKLGGVYWVSWGG